MGRTVAAIKPEAQPRPRQDSRRDKDAWDAPFPKGLLAEHVHHAFGKTSTATTLAPLVRVATTREATAASTQRLASHVACQVRPVRCQYPCGMLRSPRPTARQREGRRHARQLSAASKGVAPGSYGEVMQGRMPDHEPFRPEQASGARRREGSKPKGRDGYDGTGRSPRAWRRRAPTRPAPGFTVTKVT